MFLFVGGNALLPVNDTGSGELSLKVKYNVVTLSQHKGNIGGACYILFWGWGNVERKLVAYLADVRLSTIGKFLADTFL